MNSPSEPDIALSTPADLVSAVPYLVGYAPTESVVIVGLAGTTIAITVRIDLPPRHGAFNAFSDVNAILQRNCADAVVILAYGAPERVTRVIDHLLPMFAEFTVVDAIRVTEGRWWSYVCTDPSCCPPEGTPIRLDSRVDAAFVAEGQMLQADRAAVEAALDPVDPDIREQIDELVFDVAHADHLDNLADPAYDGIAEIVAKIPDAAEAAASGAMPDPELSAELGYAISDGSTGQTAAVAFIDSSEHGGGLALWIWLTRHLSGGYRAEAAAICAYAAWREGSGILAQAAVDIARQTYPTHRLARAVALLCSYGIPPSSIPPFRGQTDSVDQTDCVF